MFFRNLTCLYLNRGGYFADYLRVIKCKLWRVSNTCPDYAVLAVENGLDSKSSILYSSDICNCNSDDVSRSGSLSADCADTNSKRGNRIPKEVKPRLYYIDNLRVLACFLVLLTHSTMVSANPDAEGFWIFGLSFIGSPSSELFLALSGTVLLPVKTGFVKFYRRRFVKLLPPLIIWSVLGMLLYTRTHGLPMSQAIERIVRIPVQPVIGVYWFVYAMAGLYLLAPFISPWLHQASKRQIELFLGLWVVNMIFPWLVYFFPDIAQGFNANGNYYWTLAYFGGFLGYWLLGYYLKKYPIKIGMNIKWLTLLCGIIVYPVAIYLIKRSGGATETLLDNLQIGSAIMVAFLYTVMQNVRLHDRVQTMVTNVAKYSFCIYLTHIYIARDLYWGVFNGSTIHIFPRTFLIALLTLATGYLLTFVLSKLPKGKFITGT